MADYKIILRADALPLDLHNKHNELEIGFGNGEYTINYANLRPDIMLYGFEMSYSCVLQCARRADELKNKNLRIFRADAQTLLNIIFEDSSLDRIYMNFPCPWPKRRHANKRVIAGDFADNFLRVLKPNGLFELVTDDKDYAEQTKINFIRHDALSLKSFEINPEREIKTKYERRWLAMGKEIYRLVFEKVEEINNNINFKEEKINLMDLNFAHAVSEEFVKSLNGVSGRDEAKGAYWSFGRYYKGDDAFLLDAFAVDDEFKQRYYIKFHDNRMQLDNTASAYMTPAVKNSLKDIIARFNNF